METIIASILAFKGISIKNIGIVHNREFEEGVLHIEFYDEDSVDLASELQSAIQDKDIRLSEISVREEANNTMITEMHSHIAELFHKQYELLDKLSNTYYETHGFSREKDSIYEQLILVP